MMSQNYSSLRASFITVYRARSRHFSVVCGMSANELSVNLLFAKFYEMHTRSAEALAKTQQQQDSIKLFSLHYSDMKFLSTILGMIFTALSACVCVCVRALSFERRRHNEEAKTKS